MLQKLCIVPQTALVRSVTSRSHLARDSSVCVRDAGRTRGRAARHQQACTRQAGQPIASAHAGSGQTSFCCSVCADSMDRSACVPSDLSCSVRIPAIENLGILRPRRRLHRHQMRLRRDVVCRRRSQRVALARLGRSELDLMQQVGRRGDTPPTARRLLERAILDRDRRHRG